MAMGYVIDYFRYDVIFKGICGDMEVIMKEEMEIDFRNNIGYYLKTSKDIDAL